MKKLGTVLAIVSMTCVLGAAAPARAADICLQFSGVSCDLSGDLGFFRLIKCKFPTSTKTAVKLNGRACGTGSVTGTAVQSSDGSNIHIGASFVCDATFGVINADFNPTGNLDMGGVSTNAYASYGDVGLGSSCTATIVDCTTAP